MRFLCLRGFGTNNQIFKMQTGTHPTVIKCGGAGLTCAAALRYELTNHDDHSFEFVQGVLPVGAELGSIADFDEGYFAYFDPESPSGAIAALHQLYAYIASHGPFDGVIAFSQGAELAATHVVHKGLENPGAKPPFKCAILFSPLAIYDPKAWIADGKVRKVDIGTDGYAISIPCLVVWGQQDQWKEEVEGVSKLCDPETSHTFVHPGAHEIPGIGLKEALQPVAKLAKRRILSDE